MFVLYVTLALVISAVLLVGADLAYYEYTLIQKRHPKPEEDKNELRAEKEDLARWHFDEGGFFEESFARGFTKDGELARYYYRGQPVPSGSRFDYCSKLDTLVDTQIIDIAEDF